MVRLRTGTSRGRKVRFGEPDELLTGAGGVVALAELIGKLRVVHSLEAGIGAVKRRERGASGGQMVAGLAQCQLLGGQNLSALDEQRLDVVAGQLSTLPGLPSTTAAGLARRFGAEQVAGLEAGAASITARAFELLPADRREALCAGAVTIDMDSTDVEVYGRSKHGMAYNYQGQRVGRPHVAAWAQAGPCLRRT